MTPERARELFAYDPETGIMTNRVTRCNTARAGEAVGSDKGNGYLQVIVDGHNYLVHRLAWAIVTGEWPKKHVDHENTRRSDNRWINLRDATVSQNLQNARRRRDNRSGVKGVYWRKDKRKWCARAAVHGKVHYLGDYLTLAEAAAARRIGAERLHGEFARHA